MMPSVLVTLALLVPVPNHSQVQRVINTRALILKGRMGDNYYIHVYDGWLTAGSIAGPWTQATLGSFARNAAHDIAQTLSKAGTVDLHRHSRRLRHSLLVMPASHPERFPLSRLLFSFWTSIASFPDGLSKLSAKAYSPGNKNKNGLSIE